MAAILAGDRLVRHGVIWSWRVIPSGLYGPILGVHCDDPMQDFGTIGPNSTICPDDDISYLDGVGDVLNGVTEHEAGSAWDGRFHRVACAKLRLRSPNDEGCNDQNCDDDGTNSHLNSRSAERTIRLDVRVLGGSFDAGLKLQQFRARGGYLEAAGNRFGDDARRAEDAEMFEEI